MTDEEYHESQQLLLELLRLEAATEAISRQRFELLESYKTRCPAQAIYAELLRQQMTSAHDGRQDQVEIEALVTAFLGREEA